MGDNDGHVECLSPDAYGPKLMLRRLAVLFALVASPALATDRLVATSGSNTGNCSVSSCLTVGYAQGQAVAGDRVLIHTGTYTGVQTWNGTDGTSGSHITITPFGDGNVVFDCSALTAGQDCITLSADYTDFLASTGSSSTEIKGNSVAGYGVVFYKATGSSLQNAYIHTFYKSCFLAYSDTWATRANSTGISVVGNTATDCSRINSDHHMDAGGGWPSAMTCTYTVGCKFENNKVSYSWGEGINPYDTENSIVRNNVVHDTLSVLIYADGAMGAMYENNLAYVDQTQTNFRMTNNNAFADCLVVTDEVAETGLSNSNQTWQNNICNGARNGFYFWSNGVSNDGLQNAKVVNNLFVNSINNAIKITANTGAAPSGNVVACNEFVNTVGGTHQNVVATGITFSYNHWFGPASGQTGTGDVNLSSLAPYGKGPYQGKQNFILPINSPLARACPTSISTPPADYVGNRRVKTTSIGPSQPVAFNRMPRRGASPAWIWSASSGALPSWITYTRADCSPSSTCATDSLITDAAGSSYSTYATNAPVIKSSAFYIYESRTNYLLNSAATATQTTGSLGTGTYQLWCTGTGSLTSTAGTATATGLGAIGCSTGSAQTVTVTVGGTLVITKTGSVDRFQLENGAYPTSFIVTAGAATTRSADVAQITGAPLAALQGTQASVIVEGVSNVPNFVDNRDFVFAGNEFVYTNGAGDVQSFNGSSSLTDGNVTSSSINRFAFAFASSSRALVSNGGTVATDTNNIAAVVNAYIGSNSGSGQFINGYVRSIALYNVALGSSYLQSKSVVGADY